MKKKKKDKSNNFIGIIDKKIMEIKTNSNNDDILLIVTTFKWKSTLKIGHKIGSKRL